MSVLREEFAADLANLPSHTRNARTASQLAWVLAYDTDDYYELPYFWHKAVGTLITGLRLHRVHSLGPYRSDEVDAFCTEFLEHLWDKHGRKEVVMATQHEWAYCTFDFEMCYDFLWTAWKGLNDAVERGAYD